MLEPTLTSPRAHMIASQTSSTPARPRSAKNPSFFPGLILHMLVAWIADQTGRNPGKSSFRLRSPGLNLQQQRFFLKKNSPVHLQSRRGPHSTLFWALTPGKPWSFPRDTISFTSKEEEPTQKNEEAGDMQCRGQTQIPTEHQSNEKSSPSLINHSGSCEGEGEGEATNKSRS